MIRILIVDDEEPARAKLAKYLAGEEGLEVVAEAADGEAAIEAILHFEPDLVFLDIQMPRLDGLEVVRRLAQRIGPRAMPWIVFVTAHDDHALAAFDVQAIDYLLKPYARRRLRQALVRVRRRMETEHQAENAARLQTLLEEARPRPQYLEHILVKKAIHREILLPVEEIDLFRAKGNYVELMTGNATYPCRGPLSRVVAGLDPNLFLQINRGEVVRLAAVEEFQPWFRGDYRVVMKRGEVLSWSRRFRARNRGRLDFALSE